MNKPAFDCPPPDPNPRPPSFAVPAGACDCHAHVIGPAAKYPFVAERSYTPPDAPLDAYLKVLRVLGITRAVLVQPSMHGTDNSVMMNAIAQAPDFDMRAVVVVPADIAESELAALHLQGARGVRINLIYSGGGIDLGLAEGIAARIRDFGWNLEILVDVSRIGRQLHDLAKLQVPLVVDHIGHLEASKGPKDPGFGTLLDVIREGNTWVKLSGVYRVSAEAVPYGDVRPLVDALVDANPSRMLWGSDWPHTLCPGMPNDGDLLNLLGTWVTAPATRQEILVDNPAHLYGFNHKTKN